MRHFVKLLAPIAASIGVAAALASAPAPAQQAFAGGAVFRQRCATCHSTVAGKASPLGPNLAGIAGRRAGIGAFNYSPALKSSGLSWTGPALDRFLAAPGKAVPGTRMTVSVADPAQRASLVAYLGTLKQ